MTPGARHKLAPDFSDTPGTYPPFARRPFVRSGVIEAGDLVWFKLRFTNTGTTILDPEGFGGSLFYPQLLRKNERGEYAVAGEPYNLYFRDLEYLYPGESREMWFHLASCMPGYASPADAPTPQGFGLVPGEYKLRVRLIYRCYRTPDPFFNIWEGQLGCVWDLPFAVERGARDAPIAPGEAVLADGGADRKITRFIHTFEEFMTAFDCHLAPPAGAEGRIAGTLHLQVAPWTKHVVVKLIRGGTGAIAARAVPIAIDCGALAVRPKLDPRTCLVRNGVREPIIASQAMADMRTNVQIGPFPEVHIRARLREMAACGINVVSTTCMPWLYDDLPPRRSNHQGDALRYVLDVARDEGMRIEGIGTYPFDRATSGPIATWLTGKSFALADAGMGYGAISRADPLLPAVNAALWRYQFARWGDLYLETEDGAVPISVEDSWGWMRQDVNVRHPMGELTVKAFRAWLKAKYGAIEEVNAAWGSAFEDFDRIEPEAGQVRNRFGHIFEYTDPAHPFHDWNRAVADLDAFRTELRVKNYRETLEFVRKDIPGAVVCLRTEGANVLAAGLDPADQNSHFRHAFLSQRRCAAVAEIVQASGLVKYHADYTTLPYTPSELRFLVRSAAGQGIVPVFLPQFDNMRDIAINAAYGTDYQVHYNLPEPRKGYMMHCLTALFPWFQAVAEEGGIPGILWEDYQCDGFATETQKREMRLFAEKVREAFAAPAAREKLAAPAAARSDEWRRGAKAMRSFRRVPDYEFQGRMSREVLESYLARAITYADLLHGLGDVDENVRMLTNAGAKLVGRAIYRWGGESALEKLLETAAPIAAKVRRADPNGYLQMPGSRTLADPAGGKHWYWANTRSPACPDGFNQEETIKAIWAEPPLAEPPAASGASADARAGQEDAWPEKDWPRASAEEAGLDAALLASARDYALTGGGAGIVTRGGRLVLAWGDVREKFDLKSTTKSFGCIALGLALKDGLLKIETQARSLQPALGVPPESNARTGWLERIAILHLASQTAGFEKPGGYTPLLFEPGTKWDYSDSGPNWLAECLTLVWKRDLDEVMFERVFEPLGITRADLFWRKNSYRPATIEGVARREFGAGIHANADALARVGLLMLREGRWKEREILSRDFVQQASRVPAGHERLDVLHPETYGRASRHYGLLWWNNADGTLEDVPRDAYWSWGLYDSLIVVVPSLGIVAARAGKSWKRAEGADHYDVLKPFLGPLARSAGARRSAGAGAPCPPSPVIAGTDWAPPESIERHAKGSDNWPLAWADDDALYGAYGDGRGFEPFVPEKLSLGLARIEGAPGGVRGTNLRSPTAEALGDGARGRKASGLLCVGGVLYIWVRNAANSQLGWSSDHGATWTWADWKFTESFGCPSFLSFGRDYAGARDEFVYVYSHDAGSAYVRADRMVLARAPKERMRERAAYEFFARLDERGGGRWTRDIAGRGAVFTRRGGCYRSSVSYDAGLRRYLWCQTGQGEDTRVAGGFAIYDAPEPWGPWTTAFSTENWDVGPGESMHLPPKWMSADGLTVHLVFSGDDCFSVRRGTLRLRAAAP